MAADADEIVLEHDGAQVPTLVYKPQGVSGPGPAVVLSAEAYGINEFTRHVASELAAAGYAVVVPDYYRGKALTKPDDYSDFTEVMTFIGELDFGGATKDILAGIDHARSMPEVDPEKIVVWGYCTGGTLAMLAAALDRHLAGAVWFFPSQPTFPELDARHPVQAIDMIWAIACPVLLLYGDQDTGLVDLGPEFRGRFEQWGVDHQINIYPGAGHAFSAPVPPLRNHDADVASWADALAFMRKTVG
jgi:carboxymethylenebutenolidase